MKGGKTSFLQKLILFIEKKIKKAAGFLGLGNSKTIRFLSKIKTRLKKHIPAASLENLDICAAEHCNLGCFSCNHFSPLAVPEFPDIAVIEKDLRRLYELSGGDIPSITISGGEPLLNPELPTLMRVIRELYPRSHIQIITNGILLASQKDVFWEALKKYNIEMTPTKYPGIDWEKVEKRAARAQYKFSYFDLTGESRKVSRKFCLDLTGSQDMKKSFTRCSLAFCTAALRHGRVSTCCLTFNIRHFNNYFHKNIPVTERDSISIYEAGSMEEIISFLQKPIPLCRFCKSMGEEITGEWRKTEKSIAEWS